MPSPSPSPKPLPNIDEFKVITAENAKDYFDAVDHWLEEDSGESDFHLHPWALVKQEPRQAEECLAKAMEEYDGINDLIWDLEAYGFSLNELLSLSSDDCKTPDDERINVEQMARVWMFYFPKDSFIVEIRPQDLKKRYKGYLKNYAPDDRPIASRLASIASQHCVQPALLCAVFAKAQENAGKEVADWSPEESDYVRLAYRLMAFINLVDEEARAVARVEDERKVQATLRNRLPHK